LQYCATLTLIAISCSLHAETERTDETVETVIAVAARGPLAIGALVESTR
jgi:hypothetical protein